MASMAAPSNAELWAAVRAQRQQVPALWAGFDFDGTPERFTTDPTAASTLSPRQAHQRAEILANADLVERLRAYSMMGDVTADRYAALMAHTKFHQLIAEQNVLIQRNGANFRNNDLGIATHFI